jgi:hypothetical protein
MRGFVLPDGRKISVDPAAVTAVYEQPASVGWSEPGSWRPMVTSVIAIGQTNLVVPYTHDEVMEILWPTAQ